MNSRAGKNLLRIFGELIFRNASPAWAGMDDSARNEVLTHAETKGSGPDLLLLYFYLHAELPPDRRQKYAELFHRHHAIVLSSYLPTVARLKEKLCELDADYILLKGIYLGPDVYPHPALRVKGDIDVLVRETSANDVQRSLASSGGVFYGRFEKGRKHLPAVNWRDRSVEVHTHLFDAYPGRCSGDALWKYTTAHAGEPHRYDLIPELSWLMRVRNIYDDHWTGTVRMLLDLAFLQKKFRLDRRKIQRLNEELNLGVDLTFPYCAADFWPESEVLFPPAGPCPRVYHEALWAADIASSCKKRRQILLNDALQGKSGFEKLVFLLKKSCVSPSVLEATYRVRRHSSWQLPYWYVVNLAVKTGTFFRFCFRPPDVAALNLIARRRAMDAHFRKGGE